MISLFIQLPTCTFGNQTVAKTTAVAQLSSIYLPTYQPTFVRDIIKTFALSCRRQNKGCIVLQVLLFSFVAVFLGLLFTICI